MTEKRPEKQAVPGYKGAAEVIPLHRRSLKGKGGGKGKGARCPICGKAEQPEHRPFCSARCAEIDLGRWLKGVYRVPTEEAPAEGESAGPGDEEPE